MKTTNWIPRSFLFLLLLSAAALTARAGWTATGAMSTNRAYGTATLLPNGKVLAVGGWQLTSAELYNPATGTWTATGSLSHADPCKTTSTMLADGKVMVLFSDNASVEVYSYPPVITTQPVRVTTNQGRSLAITRTRRRRRSIKPGKRISPIRW